MIVNRILQLIFVTCVIGIFFILFNNGALANGQIIYRDDYKLGTEQALAIQDIDLYRSFQAEISEKNPVHFYAFTAKKEEAITARLNVPRLPDLERFSPVLALMGRGLPSPSPSQLASLPFTLPDNFGLILSEADSSNKPEDRSKIDEPYTQTSYWEGQPLARDLPEDSTYYLVVFSRKGQSGKYTLNLGTRYEAGLKETLTFPVTWLRLKVWFGQAIFIVLLLIILAIVIGLAAAIANQLSPKSVNKSLPPETKKPVQIK